MLLCAASSKGYGDALLFVLVLTARVIHHALYRPCRRFALASAKKRASGMSIALALVRHLVTVPWLSKDIIFVAVGAPPVSGPGRARAREAVESWMHAYNSPAPSYVTRHSAAAVAAKSSSLYPFARAGTILAGLCLDIPMGVSYNAVSLLVSGQHGLLPNLDTISTISANLRSHSVPWIVASERTPDAKIVYPPSLRALLAETPRGKTSPSRGSDKKLGPWAQVLSRHLDEDHRSMFRFMWDAAVGDGQSRSSQPHHLFFFF